MIEAHTTLGAELLVQTNGSQLLTPTVALEHHRSVKGAGYPDLGNAVPHLMSQIVSVADIYEAITGARSYQDPTPPASAPALRRAARRRQAEYVARESVRERHHVFPDWCAVRTSREEIGVVVETNAASPLHPVIALVDSTFGALTERVEHAAFATPPEPTCGTSSNRCPRRSDSTCACSSKRRSASSQQAAEPVEVRAPLLLHRFNGRVVAELLVLTATTLFAGPFERKLSSTTVSSST